MPFSPNKSFEAREKDITEQVWNSGGQGSGELPEHLAKTRGTNKQGLEAGEGSWLELVLKAKVGTETSVWRCCGN